ncbi:STAS domain protein [Leptospira broomii serovar Hurstbridge str. 5399]|uniref:STAS domain protein n=1 Tax=Leptospira broomii serovar Hurstbridge str. 5399 TaxID=1049789 RepID=T0GPN8_9LEPT|nr:STAS domain-containing protein [Leptospira broomii]EQA47298.1 STAS domain protein [Leptospira broomii serovar Hurstbridge str. 5399]
MELKTSRFHKILRIVPKGTLDSHSSPDLIRFLKSRWEEGDRLFLMICDSIQYLEEEGIWSLSELHSFLQKNGGNIAFVGWNEECKLVLGLFGLSTSLPIFSTERDAEEWLSSLKIEDLRSKHNASEDSIASLRQTKPLQFYSAPSESNFEKNDESVHIPEIRTIPVADAGKTSVIEDSPTRNRDSISKKDEFGSELKLEQSLEKLKGSASDKILYCESCHSRLRIRLSGRYKCPACGIEFDVNRLGGVRYLERLVVSPEASGPAGNLVQSSHS